MNLTGRHLDYFLAGEGVPKRLEAKFAQIVLAMCMFPSPESKSTFGRPFS